MHISTLARPVAVLAAAVLALGLARGALAAESWGLPEEKEVTFKAKVVDMLCELTGDCPASCGAGKHQLALKTADGKLVLPAKNVVPFAGTVNELIGFCGKEIFVDGLMTTSKGTTLFALQNFRTKESDPWTEASVFLADWAKANNVKPDSEKAEEWFRNDPHVQAIIAKQGKLGVKE
ncbi:MAG: hypothetical protein HY057_00605 [Rhodospirillales bacterium]|nr:hypothetical protein [Rhodospirillales bacterium]